MNTVAEYGAAHYQESLRYAIAVGAPYAEAEDVVQDAILGALAAAPENVGNVAGYWFKAVRNTIKGRHRKAFRRNAISARSLHSETVYDPEAEVIGAQMYTEVATAMTERERAAFDRYLAGYPAVDGNARAALYHARKRARAVLAANA